MVAIKGHQVVGEIWVGRWGCWVGECGLFLVRGIGVFEVDFFWFIYGNIDVRLHGVIQLVDPPTVDPPCVSRPPMMFQGKKSNASSRKPNILPCSMVKASSVFGR